MKAEKKFQSILKTLAIVAMQFAIFAVSQNANATNSIKWNPGHYMASGTAIKGGTITNISTYLADNNIQTELNDLGQSYANGMKGYMIYVYWSHLEPSEGVYNFAVLDAILAILKSQGNKSLAIDILYGPETGGGTRPSNGDNRFLPMYILQNPGTYGTSLPSGDANGYGGYWGAETGGYIANFTNANVLARIKALMMALGQHYDNNPNFESIVAVPETAYLFPEASAGVSSGAFVSGVEAIGSAAVAAFPHTSVIIQNTWSGTIQSTYDLQAWMYTGRISPGSPDTLGATGFENYFLNKANGDLAWGLQAYFGIQDTGITGVRNFRSGSRSMMQVQGPDMGIYSVVDGGTCGKPGCDGGPFTPVDIANAVNKYYESSHVFWTHFTGNEQANFPSVVKWSNLAPAVLAIPLTNTGYPTNYGGSAAPTPTPTATPKPTATPTSSPVPTPKPTATPAPTPSGSNTITITSGQTSATFSKLSFSINKTLSSATVQFYLNAQVSPFTLVSSVNMSSKTNFTSGQSVTFNNITFAVPANLATGTYVVTAGVFSSTASAQSNALGYVVVGNAPTPTPTPKPTPAPTPTPTPSNTVTITSGQTSATFSKLSFSISKTLSSATVQFYLNAQVSPFTLVSSVTMSSKTNFTAGQSVSFSNINFTVPANLAPGTYSVTAGIFAGSSSAQTPQIGTLTAK